MDPNLDPELALALKVSLEEAKAVQEASAKKDEATKKDNEPQAPQPMQQEPSTVNTTSTSATTTSQESDMSDLGEDDELLKQALAMSMLPSQSESPKPAPQQTVTSTTQQVAPAPTPAIKEEEMQDIDEEMALALQMSMQNSDKKDTVDINKVMEDPNFVNSVLSTLPGVDPNDETIRVRTLLLIFHLISVRACCRVSANPQSKKMIKKIRNSAVFLNKRVT